ncbi:PREDICTED: DNA-directed RNA polymerase I subunit RPA12 [Nicrophorus vespilloides]|uniref:DNA-directed RNA polymerase subunit n=1 Tax=Nicrophorus vespilloides TaxID=110193 RepID=A0ABM1N223_NICVS|nr:PREDICTED: DNA-directed RNA polymerase I subunit RPA12 [Nicrophorus vespilloides]
MKEEVSHLFETDDGFCGACGSILPLPKSEGNIVCYSCKKEYSIEAMNGMKVKYSMPFHSVEAVTKILGHEKKSKENSNDGPIVERKCPKCGNEEMSYATIQLRSADEGQTVFYTCTQCKYKESENS